MKGGTLKFLHMTDVHLDLAYTVGEKVQCRFPLCCRKNVGDGLTSYRSGRGDDSGSDERSGDWGSLEGNCDCPLNLAESLLKAVNESISRKSERLPMRRPASVQSGNTDIDSDRSTAPEYIIWTGDITPHDVWATSREEMMKAASEWTQQVTRFLSHTGIPVFPVLGNHEALPVNM